MKIVCESCGAKYSIADDRITGKVFKIRCKRCSEVIIVRGDQQPQAAEQAQPVSHDQNAIWHVVVDGEQAGPYAPSQLAELLSAGTIDWEAYVWTEGFDNWLPIRDVPDLVAQITGDGAAASQQPAAESRASTYRSAVQETLTGQPSMGADPFADDAPSDGGLFGGAPSGGPDLFAGGAQRAASPFAAGADSGVVTSAPSPRVDAAQAMTGARNENSVLFSLKNLQALATGGSGATASASMPSGASAASGGRDGYASGEGSGLIDIRALASATGVGEASENGGSRDELLSIGTQGGAFGTLGSPMLSPARDERDGNKNVLIWAAVAAVGVLSLAAVAIIYIIREPAAAATPVEVGPQGPSLTATAPSASPGDTEPEDEKPSEGEIAAKANRDGKDDEAEDEDDKREARERSGSSTATARRRTSTAGKTPERDPEPTRTAPEKPAPSKPSGSRSIDDLLDGALSGSPTKSKPAEAPAASNLPEQPSRDQVISAMSSVKAAVANCGKGGQGGVATVTVSVAGATGRVTNATVNGVTGPTGSCVAKAVRGARFPKFKSKVFQVQFPFKL